MKTLSLLIALTLVTDAFAAARLRARRDFSQTSQVRIQYNQDARRIANQRSAVQATNPVIQQQAASVTVVPDYVPGSNPNIVNTSLSRSQCLSQNRIYILELVDASERTGGGANAPSTIGTCYAIDSGVNINTSRLVCEAEGSGTFCYPSESAVQRAQSEYERRFGGADGMLNYTDAEGEEINVPISCMNSFSTAQWLYGFTNHCMALIHVDTYAQAGCGLEISRAFAAAPHPVLRGQSHALDTTACPQYNP